MSRLLCLAGGMFATVLATGSAGAEDEMLSRLPPPTIGYVAPGSKIESLVVEALKPIRNYDLDGDGLDAADVQTAEAISRARARSPILSWYLSFDLDGDLKIEEAEVRNIMRGQHRDLDSSALAPEVSSAMLPDRNRDGVVTIDEIYAITTIGWYEESILQQLRQVLAADPDSDGRVTLAEMAALARTALGGVDANGDGVIDAAEYAFREDDILRAHVAAFNPDCRLPRSAEGEELVRAFFSRGLAQPTVTVNGQDRETSLARVSIEPGDRPLYLLLTAPDMILKFEGATARLAHVVVMTPSFPDMGEPDDWAGTGIVGIARDLVTFLPAAACSMQGDVLSKESEEQENRMIAAAIGAKTPTPLGAHTTEGISLPSGRTIDTRQDAREPEPVAVGFTARQEQTLVKPGGIVELSPSDVISPGRVETYEVLPRQEGLKRLVETGFLERTPNGYRLLKPIPRWPASLAGAHGVTVFVPKGMPLPKDAVGVQVVTEP